jgi:tryptophanyl-tRNA synthetase
MAKPILVSGIQPTGRLHLGNYLGAVKNFVALQNSDKYDCYFFVADLHSLTENYEPKEKSRQILELTADLLALGLNPKKSTLFLQSLVPAHSELAWILNTITPMGELSRMTQYKEKSEEAKDFSNAGLFTYPTLMAADILLYSTKVVPVGEDQLQHLELTRTLARKFNSKFGKTFVEPKALLTETPRLMSLDDPTKKMSKSRPAGCLFLDELPAEIETKVKRATTDSESEIRYDAEKKPGVSNLLRIYAALSDKLVPDLEKEFSEMNYSEFKIGVANMLAKHFADFRESKKALLKKPKNLKSILEKGSKKASAVASEKLAEAKKCVGIAF